MSIANDDGPDHRTNNIPPCATNDKMEKNPQRLTVPKRVLFTRRAYTALLSEVLTKSPVETGGILLGYRDGVVWTVVESLDPGPDSIHQPAYFEYDQPYVTHQVNRVRNYYERPLDLLGLWHRHPGSFDRFSGTDDATNLDFARMDPLGAISGLVNVDPRQRLTLFHVNADPFAYTRVRFDILGACDSENRAPLRGIDELVYEVEAMQRKGARRKNDLADVPEVAKVDISSLADGIDHTIKHRKDALRVDSQELLAWSDDQIVDALSLLDADLRTFGDRGIPLNMRCFDDCYLELAAESEQGPQLICRLVLVPKVNDDEDVICILGTTNSPKAIPYTPGLLSACIH